MAKTSKASAPGQDHGIVEVHEAAAEGYTMSFVTFREEVDHAPLLKGLPDDMCDCPHWGYMLKGSWTVHYGDHDETFEAGDAFYMKPGHVPVAHAGSELVMFSATDQAEKVSAVIMENMQKLSQSGA